MKTGPDVDVTIGPSKPAHTKAAYNCICTSVCMYVCLHSTVVLVIFTVPFANAMHVSACSVKARAQRSATRARTCRAVFLYTDDGSASRSVPLAVFFFQFNFYFMLVTSTACLCLSTQCNMATRSPMGKCT